MGTTGNRDNATSREESLTTKRKTLNYHNTNIASERYTHMNNTNDNDNNNDGNTSKTRYSEHDHLQHDSRRQFNHVESMKMNDTKNEWFGDKLIFHDHWTTGEYTETMRIGSININGIAKQLNWLEWDTMLKTMYNLQIDMLGVTEPNVNFNNKRVLLNLREIAKKKDKNIQLATSCSNQLNTTEKKMGGTMSILAGRWAVRKSSTHSDPKGRWSSITLTGKKHRKVTLITAYRVCQQKGGEGSTVFHQQQLDFEEEGRRHINLRKQFCTDMASYVNELHANNHIVVLMGDFNDDLNLPGGQVNTMLRDCKLCNVMSFTQNDHTKLPATYHRGTKCLDMIAITDDPMIPKNSIRRAGFLPYYHHFCTDHRMVYCDISTDVLFGKFTPDVTRWSNRPFTTDNMKKCNRFKTQLKKLYTKANLFKIVTEMEKRFQTAGPDDIDEVIQDCIKYGTTAGELLLAAGRKTGRVAYYKGKPFSDELTMAAKKLHQKRNLLKYLQSRQQSNANNKKIEKMKQQIRQVYLELKEVQREAIATREQFMKKLAEKRAGEWNLSTTAAMHTILQAESSKKTFARHGAVMKGTMKGSIKNLTIAVPRYGNTTEEKQKAEWETVTDDETVYALLLRKNAQQLLRSSKCPFATGPLNDACGVDGDSRFAEKILEGTLTNDTIRKMATKYEDVALELNTFIRAMTRPRDDHGTVLPDFTWSYGLKEYRQTFRKTREGTSCGPSGINMSYWKACAEDDDIARVQAFFIEKAFRYGFSYPRWQISWHCMLQKENTPYLHRLRIIQLFEGDFNGALKYLLGRLLMYHVVRANKCNKQAFGSIPGRTAHDALITLQLIYDNARITKKVIASMFNDAAGCYDRIRPSLSSICMQRIGCPQSIAQCHTVTQRCMKHRVKTSKGVSPGFIKWSASQQIQEKTVQKTKILSGNIGGIGQGGGGSPVGWLAVLLVMIATYSTFITGITMLDPSGTIKLILHIISYVDDNTLVQQFYNTNTMTYILQGLKKCIIRWHNILKITGGDLALEKCTFCVMKWRWSNGVPQLETAASDPGSLFVSGAEIQRLDPNKGTRVLGVRLAMDGTFQDEFEYRLIQSKKMARLLYQSNLSPLDAYMVYETRFRPALEYPLAITTFTTAQLLQIQKPFIHLLLPKLGMNRHTPRAIIYGPLYRGGLGLHSLDEKQSILHFELFQGHIRRNDDIGTSLRIQTSTQQLEIGCGDLFLNTNPNVYCYSTENTRLSFLWKKCFKYNIKITMKNAWIPARHTNDRPTIMDFAVKDQILKGNKKKLQQINRCRLYLKVMWPEDLLLDRQASAMNPFLIRAQRPNPKHTLNFPFQPKPDRSSTMLWKEFIYRTFCNIRHHPNSGKLEFHLAHQSQYESTENPDQSDIDDLITSIKNNDLTLREKFDNLPEKFRHILGDLHIPEDDGLALVTALRTGDALLASDGSFLQVSYKGSHAYKLLSKLDKDQCISGSAKSPKSNLMSSSPTEHYGAIAVLVVLVVLVVHHNVETSTWPDCTLLIDNKEVVNRGNNLSPTFLNVRTFLMHDYDLWMVLVELQNHLRFGVMFEWIKSHQLSTASNPISDEEASIIDQKIKLNDEVDRLASDAYTNDSEYVNRGAFYSGVVCYHQNGEHVQDISKAISSIDSDSDILEYYQSKTWTLDKLKQVDWLGMESFLKQQNPITRCNVIQMMHDWQNTGSQKQKFYDGSNATQSDKCLISAVSTRLNKCPLGCEKVELPFHFMKCTTDVMCDTRQTGLGILTKGLRKLKTAPSLIEAIIQGIKCWTDDVEYDLDEDSHELLFAESHSRLLQTQSDIGWEFFLKGFIVKDWGNLQHSYYKSIGANPMKFTRSRWVIKLLTLLHNYRTSMWNMRNSALHGGYTKISQQVFRQRLLREVRELYRRDRSSLPLKDKDIFKLPLKYRVNQGNQHLLLWVKRAQLTFDSIQDTAITSTVQQSITSWLSNWKCDDVDDGTSAVDLILRNNDIIERDKNIMNASSTRDSISEDMTQLQTDTEVTNRIK